MDSAGSHLVRHGASSFFGLGKTACFGYSVELAVILELHSGETEDAIDVVAESPEFVAVANIRNGILESADELQDPVASAASVNVFDRMKQPFPFGRTSNVIIDTWLQTHLLVRTLLG